MVRYIVFKSRFAILYQNKGGYDLRPTKYSKKNILDLFYRDKVLTKKQILQMSGCSTMTAWRILNAHGYITSYNCNAKYYTLADIPLFDKYGLWTYENICFSKYGSLTNTVKTLVCISPSGLTKDELYKLLGVNITPILTTLYRQGKIYRKKVNTIASFIYFQPNKDDWEKQSSKREDEILQKTGYKLGLPEPERIIAVLVEIIQRHQVQLQPQQLSRRLSRKGIKISTSEIDEIFLHYQLTKKKRLTF